MAETRLNSRVAKRTVTTTEGVIAFNATSESAGRIDVAIIVDPTITTEGHVITITAS